MDGEENLQNLAVIDHSGIERHLHDLGMACASAADLFVSGIAHGAAGIAGHHIGDALDFVVDSLQTPKTTAAQRRYLTGAWRLMG